VVCNWAAPTSSSSHYYCSSSLPDTNFDVEEDQSLPYDDAARFKTFFMLFLFFMCVLHACDNVI
jgi:hypothetical protein